MISVGILGCGRIGQVHAKTVTMSDRAKVGAVADVSADAARALADASGASVKTIDEIIDDDTIDAVVICTPTDFHADQIEAAAKRGKAVLCEKPVALSAERIQQCLDAVSKTPVPLMIGFNRRFDPSIASLAQRVHGGEVGEIEMITITSRDPAPPPLGYISQSGGLFRDMMIHDFDLARFLLGEEPEEMHAVGSVLVDQAIGDAGDVDTAAVMLRTASGKICQISCSRRASYGYDQRIEVHGSKGMARVGNHHETSVEMAGSDGFRTDPTLNFFLERYLPAYRIELEYFIDCIANKVDPSPGGIDGLKAQILADTASEIYRSGGAAKL